MQRPTPEEVTAYARKIGFILDGNAFCDYYESKGWYVGRSPMKVWQAAVRTWKHKTSVFAKESKPVEKPPIDQEKLEAAKKRMQELMEREWLKRQSK